MTVVIDRVHKMARRSKAPKGLTFTDRDVNNLDDLFPNDLYDEDFDPSENPEEDIDDGDDDKPEMGDDNDDNFRRRTGPCRYSRSAPRNHRSG